MKSFLMIAIGWMSFAGIGAEAAMNTRGHCFPENNQRISVQQTLNGITEEQFRDVLARIRSLYRMEVIQRGKVLTVNAFWNSDIVNAFAMEVDRNAIIEIHGGVARHPATTLDSLALIACHEIGHHLGGPPKKLGEFRDWMSAEGQSDYFGSLKCLRELWQNEDNVAAIAGARIPDRIHELCGKSFSTENEQALCKRASIAGLQLAYLLRSLKQEFEIPEPSLATWDPEVSGGTKLEYPGTQCRLDTVVAGGVCPVPFTEKIKDTSSRTGMCVKNTDWASGARPVCWFAR